MKFDAVAVDLDSRRYDVLIGSGLLTHQGAFAGLGGHHAAIVTNDTLAPLYAQALLQTLSPLYQRVSIITLPDGEAHKAWPALNTIFTALLEQQADRHTTLFALGGGVVGDMTGFAAASYMRGIDFVQIPTTLLAMVDSSVGGKTAINHPLGKNMIGAFHQPKRVIADLALLKSLPDRELKAGLAEVIKHACIADSGYFSWLETAVAAILKQDAPALAHAVKRSVEIKANVVARDETEQNVRAYLNYGHTFGHAIEAGLGFGVWLHGEAVGAGMVAAAHLSKALGYLSTDEVERIRALIAAAGLPTAMPPIELARYLDIMRLDKKAGAGQIKYVVLPRIGDAVLQNADDALATAAIEATR
jgi:3-dehydroquinate synthase